MNKFATLRDMINWCIEKPNQGEKIDPDLGRDEGPGSVHLLVEHRLGVGPGQVLVLFRATRVKGPGTSFATVRSRPAPHDDPDGGRIDVSVGA